jgi:Flp pilus assembly protein TadD
MGENYDEALEYANRAVELEPEYEEAYHTRGVLYVEMGHFELEPVMDFHKQKAIV